MKIKSCSLLAITLFFLSPLSAQEMDKFYSVPFLKDYLGTRTFLKEIGFQEITFRTPDKLTLSGLFLTRPHATCNVIVCAGWFPGRKEGMATFYALLPEYCNILFFDARGRGESEGPLLWKVWRYGISEYKDIIGAIAYINKQNDLPIIIGGTCSGVFNAAHAIIALIKNNKLTQSHVKGLFFDSGWGSVVTMSQSSAIANIKKYIGKIAKFLHGTQKNIEQSSLYKICSHCTLYCFKNIHFLCAKPLITQYEHKTNLFDKIHQINLPILFIHSYDDTHADIAHAIQLSTLAPNKQCWWIEKSSHAKHHLIHKELYKEKLIAFINSAIKQK